MSCQKRKAEKEESGRGITHSVKRACFTEASASPSKSSQKQETDSQRTYTDEERNRVIKILEAEFEKELQAKEEEIIEIQERIHKTQRVLQYLCYAVVSDFYSREKTITSVASTRQRRIHPAVKKLLSGKGPPGASEEPRNITIPADGSSCTSTKSTFSSRTNEAKDNDILARVDSPHSVESLSEKEKKVPRYIPPKPKSKSNPGNQSEPVRGGQNKVKTILVIGNVSKWLPPDSRDDAASHKWMVYVRGPKDAPDISSFVSKVRFFLHPSYRPNDVVQVVCPPFQLSRRGWGEFPIRVQIHFRNNLNKPVDIIHNLKLDWTYSGLQTLGAETVAEVWLHREQLPTEIQFKGNSSDEQQNIKEEPMESSDESANTWSKTKHPTSISAPSLLNSLITSQSPLLSGDDNAETSSNACSSSSPSNFVYLPHSSVDHASETCKQNTKGVTQSTEACELSLSQQEMNLHSSTTKVTIPSGKSVGGTLEHSHSAVDCVTSKIQEECASEVSKEHDQLCDTKPPKLVSSPGVRVLSPSKVIQSSSSEPRLHVPNIQDLEPQPETSNAPGLNLEDAPQKVQDSSTKPSIQLVKCIDSKGNARLLRVRSDLLPKLLKRGPAVAPSPSQPAQGSPNEMVVHPQNPVHQDSSNIAMRPPVLLPSVGAGTFSSPRLAVPGIGQVLRFVRPAGDVNARPILVAANSIVQPTAAFANGNRPLLMLKDGKLFVMKSALSAAAVSSSKEIASPANPLIGKINLIKTSVPKPVDNCISTGSASLGSHSNSTSIKTTNLDSCKGVTINASKNEGDSDKNKHPMPTSCPGMLLMPRSSINYPPLVRLSSPKSDQMVQAIKKSNVFTPPILPSTSLQNMSNAPTTSPKVVMKPGKSVLKSAVSVLKSNVGATSSTSKPSSSFSVPTLKLSSLPSMTTSTTVKRIILGRTSGPSSITATSQRVLMYQELLRSIVQSCPKYAKEEVWRAVRWMIRNLSLINREAKQPEFKILHPYCAPDEQTFCSWNIGKQRACEWLRAKTVRSLLKDAGWDLKNVWTTREIVLWARFHGYTPGFPVEECTEPRNSACVGDCSNPLSAICEYGEISGVKDWLSAQANSIVVPSCDSLKDIGSLSNESDGEVDIENLVPLPSKVKIKQEPVAVKNAYDEMALDLSLHPLGNMVTKTLRSVGLSLSSEEITPGIRYPAALRVLIQAMQSLAEDLGRRALADAWGKNFSRQPAGIETSNICGAICHRPELDFLTCAGLGIRIPDNVPPTKKKEKKN